MSAWPDPERVVHALFAQAEAIYERLLAAAVVDESEVTWIEVWASGPVVTVRRLGSIAAYGIDAKSVFGIHANGALVEWREGCECWAVVDEEVAR